MSRRRAAIGWPAPPTRSSPTRASIVGSIGVISAGFGFQDLIARFGVERRVHTSGESKSMLDPFRDEKPEDVERLKRLQAEIHDGFKDWVRERRGTQAQGRRLRCSSPASSGPAKRGLELGLVDSLGELRAILQARYGAKVHLPVIAAAAALPGALRPRQRHRDRSGPSTLAALEERAHWQRFGL